MFVFFQGGGGLDPPVPPLDPRMSIVLVWYILERDIFKCVQLHEMNKNEPRHVISNNVTF